MIVNIRKVVKFEPMELPFQNLKTLQLKILNKFFKLWLVITLDFSASNLDCNHKILKITKIIVSEKAVDLLKNRVTVYNCLPSDE